MTYLLEYHGDDCPPLLNGDGEDDDSSEHLLSACYSQKVFIIGRDICVELFRGKC